jgi:hypothetical protein
MGSSGNSGYVGVRPGMADAPDAPTAVDGAGHHPTRSMVGRTGRGDACVALFVPSPAPIPGPGAACVAHPSPTRRGTAHRGPLGAVIRWSRMAVGPVAGWPVPHAMIGGRDEQGRRTRRPYRSGRTIDPVGRYPVGVPNRRYRPDPGDHDVTPISRTSLKSPIPQRRTSAARMAACIRPVFRTSMGPTHHALHPIP